MATPIPPIAKPKTQALRLHGHTRLDAYYWLRERDNPAVSAYIKAENEYTQAVMAHTEELQVQLYQEMVGRIQETDQSVPVKKGPYYYYTRTEEGKQYAIYCRKKGSLDAAEEILLDPNALRAQTDYLRVGIFEISLDHKILAYSLDTSGSEVYRIYFKDLERGEHLPDEIPASMYSAEWSNDGRYFFYTVPDDAWRSYKLYRHALGTPVDADVLIYHEENALYDVDVYKTRDKAYLVLDASGIETSEQYVLDANAPTAEFQRIQPRRRGVRYSVDHRDGTFYIWTNEDATNFKVMTAPAADFSKEKWHTFIPEREAVTLSGIDLFADYLVVYERENGLKTLRITHLESNETHYVRFDEPVYTYWVHENPEFETRLLRFTYSSLTTPNSVYDYDMHTRERELKKRQPVLGGYDSAAYETERVWATAGDGARIPISLVYKKGIAINSQTPCYLYGYGSYGANMDPAFNSNRLSLIERGCIFALAHIRGGQEMGRQWYLNGKFLKKQNTFTDFIACARHLIAAGYTSPERLAIAGRSAGGLLIGAALNMAPELFKVAIMGVPFVDVITTMLDESIPLTVGEYDEWGNPRNKAYYDYMLAYSPYDNLEAKAYPHLLVTSGLNDPRVQYWEPTKYVAKLRTLKTDDNLLLLKTNMGAGHAGASGRYDYLKEIAFEYAFILDVLEIA